jgi:predicted carbohydrate-binding protein with CBM5 and CBM33 domain
VRIIRRAATCALATVLAATGATVISQTAAQAHGATIFPGSRTYLCYKDGLSATGQIIPQNAACAEAVRIGGANALYNWFGSLQSNGGGRMAGFIPDGKICSANNPTFVGFDLARADWPKTHLTAGATVEMKYSNWAAHPGDFISYVTKDGFDPTKPLAWSDLEPEPFDKVTDPPQRGAVGTLEGHYYWNAKLPANKTGQHIIFTLWTRSDSQETFYTCSDVVFDGGNGAVTGLGE